MDKIAASFSPSARQIAGGGGRINRIETAAVANRHR